MFELSYKTGINRYRGIEKKNTDTEVRLRFC